jgi:hypothetical protein
MDELIAALKAALETAITAHYQRVTAEHDDIYGYVLVTVDTVEVMLPHANPESALRLEPDDEDYALKRFRAEEWVLDEDYGLFTEVQRTLGAIDKKVTDVLLSRYTGDDVDQVENATELVLEAGLEILQKLEAAGHFGPRTDKRFVSFVIAHGGDHPFVGRGVKLLNSASIYREYEAAFPYECKGIE